MLSVPTFSVKRPLSIRWASWAAVSMETSIHQHPHTYCTAQGFSEWHMIIERPSNNPQKPVSSSHRDQCHPPHPKHLLPIPKIKASSPPTLSRKARACTLATENVVSGDTTGNADKNAVVVGSPCSQEGLGISQTASHTGRT